MWRTPPDPISLAELCAAIGSRNKSLAAPSPQQPEPTAGGGGAGDYPPSAVSNAAPSGEPLPVHASQPGPAL